LGSEVNQKQTIKNRFLHAIASNDLFSTKTIIEQYPEIVSEKISENWTALHIACDYGFYNIVALLLEHGALVNAKDEWGIMPIHFACNDRGGLKLSIVKALSMYGTLVNEKSGHYGMTPLHLACLYGHSTIVKFLLEIGANVSEKSFLNCAALHYACTNNKDNLNIVEILFENGACVNDTMGDFHTTPLHMACSYGNKDIAKFLLNKGAAINGKNDHGNTPLHLASETRGNQSIVKLLLEYGALVDQKNIDGDTPLHCACANGDQSIVALLLQRGACINEIDNSATTPLHLACYREHWHLIELLLQSGALGNKKNKFGQSPFSIVAQSNGHKSILELLRQYESAAD
jgi:ankyrin/serine/threonine-protein phosphatase 6 regulatory ankyrin repeat subunit B